MIYQLLTPVFVAALSVPPVPTQDPTAPDVRLEIRYPEAGATLSEGITVSLKLIGPATREYELELRCAETTHYFLADEQCPSRNVDAQGVGTWHLHDPWFLPQAGPLELELRVFDVTGAGIGGEQRLLLERTVPFRYAPLTGEALQEAIGKHSSRIANIWMRHAERIEPRQTWYHDSSVPTPAKLHSEAMYYVEARRDWMTYRVTAYSMLANTYEHALLPGDALRALRCAKSLYDAESGEIVRCPPLDPTPIIWRPTHWTSESAHHRAWSNFYAKRKDLSRAQHHLEQGIAYYRDQLARHGKLDAWHREMCSKYAAVLMGEIGKLHYLLARDREGYERWMAKRQAAMPREGGGGGLLDQRRP